MTYTDADLRNSFAVARDLFDETARLVRDYKARSEAIEKQWRKGVFTPRLTAGSLAAELADFVAMVTDSYERQARALFANLDGFEESAPPPTPTKADSEQEGSR